LSIRNQEEKADHEWVKHVASCFTWFSRGMIAGSDGDTGVGKDEECVTDTDDEQFG
jgi:hypothetical protein